LISASACSDPIKDAQLIEELRVLAARLEVTAEPGLAWPRPGDDAVVRWLVVAPGPAPAFAWQLVACLAEPGPQGLPQCVADPFATVRGAAPAAAPEVAFHLPPEQQVAPPERLAVLGVFCSAGEPELEAELLGSRCSRGATILADFETQVAASGEPNRNPTLSDASIELDGGPWSPPTEPAGAIERCAERQPTPALPAASAGSRSYALRVVLDSADRDAVVTDDSLTPEHEELQVSEFATAGLLDRQFSFIEPTAESFAVETTWEPPKAAPDGGRLVRFYFVVRDLRGGVDWSERHLCLVQ
jgi:hypothetical protein